MVTMASYLYHILPALGGYTLASLYLLKNPQILHKKKRSAFYCNHISHRGGAGEKIESTIEAFTHAVNEGTHMLELDCHLTRDDFVVVSHDENLLRQTGHDVTISSLNLEDLPLYKERLEVTFYAGRYSTGENRKFVQLEDIFKKFPSMPVNIEIKEDNDLLIKKISSLVKQYDREKITVWASVKSSIMKKCRKENSVMPFMFTMTKGLQLLLLYYTGLLPFVPLGESFLQFYLPQIINRTYVPESFILRNGMVIFLIEKLTMRKSLFKHLAKRGIQSHSLTNDPSTVGSLSRKCESNFNGSQVHLFVCNEERDIEAAFAVGATGVMTDYPSILSKYIHAHPPISHHGTL